MIDWDISLKIATALVSVFAACVSICFSLKAKKHADTVLLNSYIAEAVQEFEKKGSPLMFIKTLVLPDTQKEIIWKNCHLRLKGRLPERNFSDTPLPSASMSFSLGEHKPVLLELGDGQFDGMTVKVISQKTGVSIRKVVEALKWFFANDLAQKKTEKDETYWSLTEKGWRVYEENLTAEGGMK